MENGGAIQEDIDLTPCDAWKLDGECRALERSLVHARAMLGAHVEAVSLH